MPDTLLSLAVVEQKVSGSLWSSRNGIALRNNTVLAVPSAHTHTQFNLRLWKQAPLQDVPSSVNYMSFLVLIEAKQQRELIVTCI